MSLILNQEAAGSIPNPVAGKGTVFMNTSDQLSVKSNSGVVATFPTILGSNTQVFFNDAGTLNGNANLVFDKTTGITTGFRINATANITTPQLISNVATGTAPLVVTSTTTVANLAVATATTAGTVTTAAQGNITSVGTLTSLGVTGNITAGNVNTSGTETATRFISNIATGTAPLTVTSTTRVANLSVDYSNVSDFINVTAPGTGTGYIVFANATTGNVAEWTTAGISSNLANNSITATTFVGALSGAATSATTAGTVTTAAQPNITSTGTLTSLGVTGNITAGNINTSGTETATRFISNIATGTAPLTVTSTTRVANLSVDYANVSDFISVAAGTGNNFIIFANAATGNISELTSTGLIANLSNNSITATTFVGALSGAATTAGTVTTAAQGNITSVGTLTGLGVNGTVTAVNITANTGVFTGNANGISSVQAGNIVGTTLGATVVTSSLTTVGTLGSLTVTGNVTGGNLVTAGVLSVTGTGVSSIGGNLDMTSNTIINLATPTNSTDAATKQYVDDVAQGLNIHDSCNAATQTTLATISGGTITYNNGTAGVGATLTTTGTYTTIDGVPLADGMRILVKNEATAANNGIYVRTSATVLTRAADFNTPVEMEGGDFTFITAGTLYDNTGWVMTDPVTTVGTSPVNWVQFSGAGAYQAGTGLTLTGTTFSVNASQTQVTSVGTLTSLGVSGAVTASTLVSNVATGTAPFTVTSTTQVANLSVATAGSATTAGTVTTAAQGNITSVGTLTGLGVNGTITGVNITANTGVFTGNANGLSSLQAGNLTGTVAQARLANSTLTLGNTTLTLGGTTTTVAGLTNITSTQLTSNVATGTAPLVVSSTTQVANLSVATAGSATTAGTVTTAAQPNITSVGTLTSLTSSGSITSTNANAFGVTLAGSANANLLMANIGDNDFFRIYVGATATNAGFAEIATADDGNEPIYIRQWTGGFATLIRTATILDSSGNTVFPGALTASSANVTGQLISTVATGTAPLVVTSTTQVANLSVATAGSATTAGTVTTAAQPNITSVGTLTSLGVTGNVTAGNLIAGAGAGGNITGANLVSANFFTGTLTTAAQPNITSVGTLTGLTLSGTLTGAVQIGTGTATHFGTTLTTGANSTAGTITGNWSLSAGSRLNATYADLAEKYSADANYEPGTILIFGGNEEVTISTESDSFRVAGVVSTNPAYVMNIECEGEHVVDLALMGRVPCKVIGPIVKGDLITTSEIAGFGKANNEARAGTIIGKALENFNGPTLNGLIEVLVGRS